jgi:hypothetical protein
MLLDAVQPFSLGRAMPSPDFLILQHANHARHSTPPANGKMCKCNAPNSRKSQEPARANAGGKRVQVGAKLHDANSHRVHNTSGPPREPHSRSPTAMISSPPHDNSDVIPCG